MRSVWWLNACSTLTLTLPLLFSPHPLGSRREQLLPEFPPQRSPFLPRPPLPVPLKILQDRKSTRLNSSHVAISYAVFCLKKKTERVGSAEILRDRKRLLAVL